MMQSVAVLSRIGRKLMPTNAYRARKLLKSGRAGIECYKPMFTIRLTDREEGGWCISSHEVFDRRNA